MEDGVTYHFNDMAILKSSNNQISIKITNISANSKFMYKEDYNNWISVLVELDTSAEKIEYSEVDNVTLSVLELKNIIERLKALLSGEELFEYYSIERYFDLIIRKSKYEEDLFETEIWFNMGTYTKGKVYGFDKGYKFSINKEILIEFYNAFYHEFITASNIKIDL